MKPEEEIIKILKDEKVDQAATLPCDRAKNLFSLVEQNFRHVPLSREEEGVGICAGAHLAGGKPVMIIQSSGMGNIINALCSLTKLYELPLPILVSWRGVYKENILAQVPMGRYLPRMLDALDIKYTEISNKEDIQSVRGVVRDAYKNNKIHVALLSPNIWKENSAAFAVKTKVKTVEFEIPRIKGPLRPSLTRFELIKASAPYLKGKLVVSNIGVPGKELYHILRQSSNFYMLGSMGMASPIGLGMALNTRKEVIVIDGDGSLLMNPSTLATISVLKPENLTILAIDNGAYGSTGNQQSPTSICVDLGGVASAFGIKNISRVSTEREVKDTFESLEHGPNFIHALAIPGNAEVQDIPLTPLQIKSQVMEFLR